MYAVYHLIHAQTPHQHNPKLVVTDVPEDEKVTKELLERAGFAYEEFGILWANHVVKEVDARESPADLVAKIRQGVGDRITYADLVAKANAPLGV